MKPQATLFGANPIWIFANRSPGGSSSRSLHNERFPHLGRDPPIRRSAMALIVHRSYWHNGLIHPSRSRRILFKLTRYRDDGRVRDPFSAAQGQFCGLLSSRRLSGVGLMPTLSPIICLLASGWVRIFAAGLASFPRADTLHDKQKSPCRGLWPVRRCLSVVFAHPPRSRCQSVKVCGRPI